MTVADETVVEQGITTPEAQEENQQQEAAAQEGQVTSEESSQEENSQDRNWRQMRQSLEELRQANNRLTEEIGSQRRASQPQEATKGADWEAVEGSDLLTKEQTLNAAEKIAAEAVKKALQQREHAEAPKLIEDQHKDYSLVVTPENVERLKQTNPRLAASLGDIKDPYAQGTLAYAYIKSTGIYKESGDPATRQRALDNSKKPMSVTATKSSNALESANAYANGLTPDLKAQLWKEMQTAIRKG